MSCLHEAAFGVELPWLCAQLAWLERQFAPYEPDIFTRHNSRCTAVLPQETSPQNTAATNSVVSSSGPLAEPRHNLLSAIIASSVQLLRSSLVQTNMIEDELHCVLVLLFRSALSNRRHLNVRGAKVILRELEILEVLEVDLCSGSIGCFLQAGAKLVVVYAHVFACEVESAAA